MQTVEYLSIKKLKRWQISGRIALIIFYIFLAIKMNNYLIFGYAIILIIFEAKIFKQQDHISKLNIHPDMVVINRYKDSPTVIASSEIKKIEEDIVFGNRYLKVSTNSGAKYSFFSNLFTEKEYHLLKKILNENYMKIDSKIKFSSNLELIVQTGFILFGLAMGLLVLFYHPEPKISAIWFLNPLAAILGIFGGRTIVKLYFF